MQWRTLATEVQSQTASVEKFRVLVVGGGSAGMAVSSQLATKHRAFLLNTPPVESTLSGEYDKYRAAIGVVEPSDRHYYQPLWTLVGGGVKKFEESHRPTDKLMEPFVKSDQGNLYQRIASSVLRVHPSDNTVKLKDGRMIKYDYLVVAVGLECKWDKIPGLEEALHDVDSGVTSNYSSESVEKTARLIEEFKGGNAVFTQPASPIKCAGAPQKIMYLAEERWRLQKCRDLSDISFYTGAGKIFAVEKYARSLTEICRARNLSVNVGHDLVAVDGSRGVATFQKTLPQSEKGTLVDVNFDFMHATPQMGPASFIKDSGIANAGGWVDVDPRTLQHTLYRNIFSLGDCSSVPVSKTASAVAAESGVCTQNLIKQMEADIEQSLAPGSTEPSDMEGYSGYTACPLVTGKSSLILAEFNGFTLEPNETFWFDQSKESLFLSVLKTEILPIIYWDNMMKGTWEGPAALRRFFNPRNRN